MKNIQSKRLREKSKLGPNGTEASYSLYFSEEPENEYDYYGEAFLDAARILSRSLARKRGHKKVDPLPALFLYRHSIELSAKALVLSGNRLMSVTAQGRTEKELFEDFAKSKHSLVPLLSNIEDVFNFTQWDWFWPNSEVETFSDVKNVFAELQALDKGSFAFRYPTNLAGKRSVGTNKKIGLASYINTLDCLAEALLTVVFALDAEYIQSVTDS